jgi:hypothetical protein
MISSILFSLSALCFAAMLAPARKPKAKAKASMPGYSYHVGMAEPLPTWKRKTARPARVSEPVY